MLIESQEKNGTETIPRIKCGNCKSEFAPRLKDNTGLAFGDSAYDYSCPVCQYGKFSESFKKKGKQILHD